VTLPWQEGTDWRVGIGVRADVKSVGGNGLSMIRTICTRAQGAGP